MNLVEEQMVDREKCFIRKGNEKDGQRNLAGSGEGKQGVPGRE